MYLWLLGPIKEEGGGGAFKKSPAMLTETLELLKLYQKNVLAALMMRVLQPARDFPRCLSLLAVNNMGAKLY